MRGTERELMGGCRGFGESVKRIAKQVQGALPIVGLLSRLAAPEGGFDELVRPLPVQRLFPTKF
jgi:hypothetical protein